ncbi:MAG: FecR domain-containing protein [Rhodoferax sp.]|jgi:hypothetical protein|nr:FecR domain-containing protein [Rhodoferax sp.]
MKHPFKLKNAALLMALAAAYPLTVHGAAGVAQFAVGDVTVRRGAANLPVAKGQAIESGDNIVTGASGQTQIRFSDGGLVSLTPNSQFNINRYADENDGNKDSFAVSFLRGSMRAITGLIGKRKAENYKVTTNTATIGIRGSAFSAKINPDGTMDVAGEQDTIEVCTNAGCVSLIVGEIVRVDRPDSLPRRTAQRSNVPPLVARKDLFIPENPAEITPITLPSLLSGEIDGMSALFSVGNGNVDYFPRGGQEPSDGLATFVAGQMVTHVGTVNPYGGGSATVQKTSAGAGTFGYVGTATDPGLIAWGYWDTGSFGNELVSEMVITVGDPADRQGVHYVVGRPTPLAQMPSSGTAHFGLLGGTVPTAWDSETHTLLFGTLVDASLRVDFLSGHLMGSVNTTFTVDGETVAINILDYASIHGATFQSTGCEDGYFSGFFTGNQASRAGLAYGRDYTDVGEVRGTAVLVNGGLVTEESGIFAMFASGDDFIFDDEPRGDPTYGGSASFIGTYLLTHDDEHYNGSSILSTNSSSGTSGALGAVGDADFIGWGYWANANAQGPVGNGNLRDVHYLVGRPTPDGQMPVTGTATYDLAGGTRPTATSGGTTLVGTLLGATLNANFGAGYVEATVNTQFTQVGGAVVNVNINDFASISGSRFTSVGCPNGTVNGFFAGNLAARAGIVYSKSGTPVGLVRGAAGFNRGASSGLSTTPDD